MTATVAVRFSMVVTVASRNQASTPTQHCSQKRKTSGKICQNQHNSSMIVAFCRRTVGWFLQQNPGESCSSAGHAAYWDAVSTNQTSFDNGTLSTQVSLPEMVLTLGKVGLTKAEQFKGFVIQPISQSISPISENSHPHPLSAIISTQHLAFPHSPFLSNNQTNLSANLGEL